MKLFINIVNDDKERFLNIDSKSIKKIDIKTFKDATKSYWNIECGLHWKLDVILDEDYSTKQKGNSITFNLAKLDKSIGDKLTLNKKITRYNHDFKNIENLIFHVIPSL